MSTGATIEPSRDKAINTSASAFRRIAGVLPTLDYVAVILIVSVASLPLIGQERADSKDKESISKIDKEVRELLGSRDFSEAGKRLQDLNAQAYDTFAKLLDDSESSVGTVTRIYFVLSMQKGDRSRFAKSARRDLLHRDELVRANAVALLASLGSREDSSRIVSLLADQQGLVQIEAARALAKIGERDQLPTLEKRMEAVEKSGERTVYLELKRARDAWKERLDKEQKR